jgi:hypothetical protein
MSRFIFNGKDASLIVSVLYFSSNKLNNDQDICINMHIRFRRRTIFSQNRSMINRYFIIDQNPNDRDSLYHFVMGSQG